MSAPSVGRAVVDDDHLVEQWVCCDNAEYLANALGLVVHAVSAS